MFTNATTENTETTMRIRALEIAGRHAMSYSDQTTKSILERAEAYLKFINGDLQPEPTEATELPVDAVERFGGL
jgi:hypothetical protein